MPTSTLSGETERPKVADAVIEAPTRSYANNGGIADRGRWFKSHGCLRVFMECSSETSMQCGRNSTTAKSAPDSFGEICRIYPHTAGTRLSEMREKDAF